MVRLKCLKCEKAWYTNNKPWKTEKARLEHICIYCNASGHMTQLKPGEK